MRYLYSVLIIFLFASCATMFNTTSTRYVVKVDAYGNDSYLNSKKYILASDDSTLNENSLQYIEFSDYIRKILNSKGYIETTSWDNADLMIFFKYGISDPRTFQATRSVPMWGKTGVSSVNTTSQTTGSANGSTYGSVTGSGNTAYGSAYSSSSDNSTTTTRTNVTPSYGVTGYRQQTSTYTKYFRYVTLSAYDLNVYKENKNEKIVWNTIITSDGSSDDLRKVIPYLVTVGASYFGKSSGEKKTLEIYENDERVNQLKGISNVQ